MESVVDSTGYELRILHAAADGVEPALLLSAPGKKAEYLLNVPDGFSRLALEHKSTPSGRLSCILLTSLLPAATGGLGGLMLRLRHDGHGQVQMIGPSGATAVVHSLRHICRWRHPKVFVSECCANRPPPVFEDDHVVIVPIVDGDQTAVCLWCLYGASESPITDQQKNVADRASSIHECSSTCSSGSSVASEDSSDSDCSSDQEIPSDPRRGSNIILPLRRKREGNLQPLSDEEHKFFKQVRLKLDRSKRVNIFAVLPGESHTQQPPENGSGGELGVLPTLRLCTQGEEETRAKQCRNSGIETFHCVRQPMHGLGSADGKEMQENPVVPSVKRFDWLIQNSQEVELPDLDEEANPVFQLSPSPEKQQDKASGEAESTGFGPSSVLGYVCYLRNLRTAVLIVDCKSKEHSESLRAHPLLSCRNHPCSSCKDGEESEGKIQSLIAAVVDISPRSIIESRYHEVCMESIRSSASQVIVRGVTGEFGFQSSLATLAKLNCIHELIFPLPPRMDICSKVAKTSSEQAAGVDEKILNAALCMRLIFKKSGTSVDYSLCPVKLMKLQEERRQKDPDSGDTRVAGLPANGTPVALSANGAAAAALKRTLQPRNAGNLLSNPALQSSTSGETDLNIKHGGQLQSLNGSKHSTLHRTRTQVREETSSGEVECDFQLVFFGTGCAEPSKKRGSSGILLQVKGTDKAMLMEAGEGVAGQFVRRFGEVKAETFICSLECLWLSHKHGDHVLGVLSVLEARRLQKEPLVMIGPQKVGVWLSEVKEVRAAMGCPIPEFHFIPCQDVAASGRSLESKEDRKYFDRVLCRMQLQSVRLIRVFHCFDAYGIILRGKSGWSIVYSGDTRPCKALERAGHGCSVLIHEATFEDELIEQARQKRHSTVSEALKAGLQMGAEHIILTHFSQRYPEMVSMCSNQNRKVAVAFDGMVVPSHLLESLSNLLPLVTSLFQKSEETKSLISGQDEDHSTPNNHVAPAEGTGFTHSSSKELEDDDTDSRHLAPASIHSSLPRLNTKCEKRSDVEAKHIRWCEDSDDVDVGGSPADLVADTVAVKWSSDSEDEKPFQLPVFRDRSRPRVRVVETNAKADTLQVRKSSLVTARESSFDTVCSPVTKFCAEDEGQRRPVDRPRNQEHGCVSRVHTIHRNNIMKGGLQAAVHPFLQQVERYESLGTCGLNKRAERSRPSHIVVEGPGTQSGKHIRWHDSDSEE